MQNKSHQNISFSIQCNNDFLVYLWIFKIYEHPKTNYYVVVSAAEYICISKYGNIMKIKS